METVAGLIDEALAAASAPTTASGPDRAATLSDVRMRAERLVAHFDRSVEVASAVEFAR
jgi:hypothetical protein